MEPGFGPVCLFKKPTSHFGHDNLATSSTGGNWAVEPGSCGRLASNYGVTIPLKTAGNVCKNWWCLVFLGFEGSRLMFGAITILGSPKVVWVGSRNCHFRRPWKWMWLHQWPWCRQRGLWWEREGSRSLPQETVENTLLKRGNVHLPKAPKVSGMVRF